ncbi:MAG TPA: hypothetical protein VM686_17720 [Polyangiaceae bacterium]|jgi:hypothetical protein|nr:hypothetical protein [Polyangiaceae bacterium]
MNTKHTEHDHVRRALAAAGAVVAVFAAGCGGDPEVTGGTTVAAYPDNYYSYGYYYPADLAYSVPYYVDDWYNYPYLYSDTEALPLTNPAQSMPGGVLRAIARGEDVCPGQVTVQVRKTEVGCGGDEDDLMQTGAFVTIDNCKLEDGGKLSGQMAVDSRRSVSNLECNVDTVVNVAYSGTFTNLSYTSPQGERTVISAMALEGAYTRLLNDRPAAISQTLTGKFKRYDDENKLAAEVDMAGTTAVVIGSPDDSWSYQLFGPLTFEDKVTDGTATARATGLAHQDDCCHPVGGTVLISTGLDAGDDLLEFGATCGQATLNGDKVELPPCE